MIDLESDPGSWADAIAHSLCLRVEVFGGVEAALAAVEAGHAERICAQINSMTGAAYDQ